MIRFYKTPWMIRVRNPDLVWKLPDTQSIYLTFDDGPNPEVTPWVLNELARVNAKATFFCLGKNLRAQPSLASEIIKSGHTIGNHTDNHLNGWKTLAADYHNDIRACDDELMKLGVSNQLFRPPYGRVRSNQLVGLKNRRIIMWSHLSWDFDARLNVEKSLNALKKASEGSILVFHDSKKAFSNLKKLLPEVLSHFHNKGFKFDALA